MENRSAVEVFSEYLDARKFALLAIFSKDPNKYNESQVIAMFKNFMQGVADTLVSVISLFMATSLHSIQDNYLRGNWGERGIFYCLANSITKDEYSTGTFYVHLALIDESLKKSLKYPKMKFRN